MANENDIGGKVDLNITDFKANIAELNRQIKIIDSGFKAAAAGMDNWADSEEGLQARIKSLNDITDLQREKVANLTTQYKKIVDEKGADSKAAQDLLVKINKETEALNKNETELRKSSEALNNFGKETDSADEKSEKFNKTLDGLVRGIKTVGTTAAKVAVVGIAAVGAAAAATVGGIVKFANDSTKAMNQLQAQTGATDEEMAAFRDTANEIYKSNVGESISDIANAMSEVKRTTGTAGDELEGLTRNALLLRDTFEFDINESARTANSLMKQFGISGEEAMTLIAQGAQNGANKNGDLLDTLNEYAPQFQALGFSAEEFTDILIQGAENGAFSIDKVGDAVKEFNIRAKDGSDSTSEAFEQLGLNADQIGRSFAEGGESAQDAFGDVIAALKKVEDPVKRNQIGVALFGTQFEDLEATAILALGDVQSKADATADTLEKINQVKFNDLGSALEGLKRQIFTGLQPITDSATTMISGIVDGIRNGDWSAVGTAVSDGISGMVGQLADMLPDFSGVAATIIGGLVGSIVEAIPTVLPAVIGAAMQLLQTLVGVLTNNGPLLITAAIQAITQLLGGIADMLPSVIQAAVTLVKTLAEGLIENIPLILDSAVEIIFSLVDSLLDLLPELIPVALQLIITLAKGLIDALPKLIAKLPEIIKTVVNVLVDNLPLIIDAAIDIVLALVKGIIQSLPEIVQAAIEITFALLGALIKAIPEILAFVPKLFSELVKAFKEIDWGKLGKDLIAGITNGVKNAAKNLANSVADAAKGALNAAKDFLGIHSPSRVMRDQVGKMIGAGMAEGIASSARQVNAAMKDLNGEIVPKVSVSGSAGAGGSKITNHYNFEGMMAGATFVARNEQDFETIAQRIVDKVTQSINISGRELGGARPI